MMVAVRESMADVLDATCLAELTLRNAEYVPDFVI
jgi:hypothetical protein